MLRRPSFVTLPSREGTTATLLMIIAGGESNTVDVIVLVEAIPYTTTVILDSKVPTLCARSDQ
jgi:hypothetical protein